MTEPTDEAVEALAANITRLAEDLAAFCAVDVDTAVEIIRATVTGSPLPDLPPLMSTVDETGGMTLDELIPEIDSFLAEYKATR